MNYPIVPPRASNLALEHDIVFYTITALTVFFTLLVGVLVVFFTMRYRAGNRVNRSRPVHEHLPIELAWTITPLLLGIMVFLAGAKLYVRQRTPPPEAMEIFVIGKQWMWHVQHSNGVRENNTIHVPLGKPVKLVMISQDVIHAMYIPAFRQQFQVYPGRYTEMWFTPTQVGKFHLFCNMYCGTQHSEMGGYVYVMPPDEFAEWLDSGGNDVRPTGFAAKGQQLFEKLNCGSCHGEKDTPQGTSLRGLLGKERRMKDGTTLVADQDYLVRSITHPYEHLVEGYGQEMPAYDTLTPEQVLQLAAYVRTLSSEGKASSEDALKTHSGSAATGDDNPAFGAYEHLKRMDQE